MNWNVDIVHFNADVCRHMYFHVKWYRTAVRRGLALEIQYGPLITDHKQLANTVQLAYELIRLGNGKVGK